MTRVSFSLVFIILCYSLTFVNVLPYLASSNQPHRKNESKSALALVRETVKDNDEPERMPPPPAVKSGCNHIYKTAACFKVTLINRLLHRLKKLC